jgi:hypothetical protein
LPQFDHADIPLGWVVGKGNDWLAHKSQHCLAAFDMVRGNPVAATTAHATPRRMAFHVHPIPRETHHSGDPLHDRSRDCSLNSLETLTWSSMMFSLNFSKQPFWPDL